MGDARKQLIVAALLVYAAKVVYYCPCRRVVSCHKKEFFLSVALATGIVAHDLGS